MKSNLFLLTAGAALAATTACSSGSGSRTPDEFRVVTMAPLTVPPEYQLRPPGTGDSLPAEVDPQQVSTVTAFGTTIGTNASASERALVAAAEANAVSGLVRAQVDYEETKTIRKKSSVVDRILFWQSDEADEDGDSATGGGEITIERAKGAPTLKLPGT